MGYFRMLDMEEKKTLTIDAVKDADVLIEILESGAVFPITVTGRSMTPYLKDGRDTVWLRKTELLKRGQIVFFRRRSGEFILHRIRKIYTDGRMLINGDAQTWCETVLPEMAAAVVCAVTRDGITRDAGCPAWKLRDLLWYPTRPVRPFIFRAYACLRRLFK